MFSHTLSFACISYDSFHYSELKVVGEKKVHI